MTRSDGAIGERWARALCGAAVLWGVACAQPEDREVDAPRVVIEGATRIEQGRSISLQARTLAGQDTAYSWESSDPAVASVEGDGQVTGHTPGEATVSAEGQDSGLRGQHVVVVVAVPSGGAPDAGPDAGPTVDPREGIPHYLEWLSSGHADATSEAFTHWDEDGEVETACATCHSADGFLDFVGADGSASGSIEKAGSTGAVIDCAACHDPATEALSSVTFPSGVRVDGLGAEARCMTCHQGRASGADLDVAIAEAKAGVDEASEALGFTNIHYYPAGATLYAGKVGGGYQYDGKVYDYRFRHVPGAETCTGCHDPHTLQVRLDTCTDCHAGVESNADLHDIRMIASAPRDYDGDGDLQEGIWHEVEGLRALLLRGIQAYPAARGNPGICYDDHAYPYFFADVDGDGACGPGEAIYPNAYHSWTPRLLRAAYNYQLATKDPGAFAHNAKYIIQLLHDSIADLSEVVDVGVDVARLARDDAGHFDGAGEAARHWDEDEEVSSRCSKCHGGAEGLRGYVELGVPVTVAEPDNGLDCATCHERFGLPGQAGAYALRAVDTVEYPGGVSVGGEALASNLCRTCHAGRESGATVQATIDSGRLRFRNVHYLPAAGLKEGKEVGLGYEWDNGKDYAGAWTHGENDECTSCHAPVLTQHTFRAADAFDGKCATCHADAGDTAGIRNLHLLDYDGDGDVGESLSAEVDTLAAALLAQLQLTALGAGAPLCYDGHRYPYFIADTDGSGSCDADEGEGFSGWTPELLGAAHNYQISQKEPGAWAHNFDYMAQLLIDSIEVLGGDVSGYVRP